MKLPVPLDTQSVLKDNNMLLKASNLGLLFNKYVSSWQNGWQMKEEDSKKFRQSIANMTFAKEHIANLAIRQQAMIQSLKNSGWHVDFFNGTTDSRLIIGLGGTSVIETGMSLHPLYGFPYLPGSGLKGLTRAYAEIGADASKEELHVIFGSDNKDPRLASENIQGRVFFMDGLPTTFPKLELDIMNPHYGDYYSGKKDSKGNPTPPADYLNPVPVTFLAVAAGQTFSFAVYSRDKGLAEKAKSWLIRGLEDLGAGGKTNVGYGYFKLDEQSDSTTTKTLDSGLRTAGMTTSNTKPVGTEKDNLLSTRLKAIKNPQTFTDFIKGIKEDETEALSAISFKGMESIINIGLLGALESADASADIKRIIAQKMLGVCKEPDKKYTEKLEKYKELQAIAGL